MQQIVGDTNVMSKFCWQNQKTWCFYCSGQSFLFDVNVRDQGPHILFLDFCMMYPGSIWLKWQMIYYLHCHHDTNVLLLLSLSGLSNINRYYWKITNRWKNIFKCPQRLCFERYCQYVAGIVVNCIVLNIHYCISIVFEYKLFLGCKLIRALRRCPDRL